MNTHPWEKTTLQTQSKGTILIIDNIPLFKLGFLIHEAIAIERGNMPLKVKRTNYGFECLGIPPSKAAKFHTVQHVFM